MAEVAFVVTPRRQLLPATDHDARILRELKPGTFLTAKTAKPRNLAHHNKFWAIVKAVASNSRHYRTPDDVVLRMKLRAGFFRTCITEDGEVIFEPKSLRFDSCDQVEFDAFYKHVLEDLFVYWAPDVPEDKRPEFVRAMLQFTE